VVIVVVLFMCSHQDFIGAGNSMAAEHGSLNDNDFTTAAGQAAGTAVPSTWYWTNTFGVTVAGSWPGACNHCITFIAGDDGGVGPLG
jgi:hypothetical protein